MVHSRTCARNVTCDVTILTDGIENWHANTITHCGHFTLWIEIFHNTAGSGLALGLSAYWEQKIWHYYGPSLWHGPLKTTPLFDIKVDTQWKEGMAQHIGLNIPLRRKRLIKCMPINNMKYSCEKLHICVFI